MPEHLLVMRQLGRRVNNPCDDDRECVLALAAARKRGLRGVHRAGVGRNGDKTPEREDRT